MIGYELNSAANSVILHGPFLSHKFSLSLAKEF